MRTTAGVLPYLNIEIQYEFSGIQYDSETRTST